MSIPVVAFAGLVVAHLVVRTRRERAERGAAFYRLGLARTAAGECALADWPLEPAAPAVVRERLDLRVSGSNMSGKSTWLRSIGLAAVLAQAGGTVCARQLRMSPLAVGASIRIVDSLQAGASHFYAEILRRRAILDLTTARRAVLFLVDEMLHGTNSEDRAAGGESFVHALLERGALGLVTTHDLSLARIAQALGERARNVHFVDRLEGGRMVFDYRVHPGVVKTRNALALMRRVGLPVQEPGPTPSAS